MSKKILLAGEDRKYFYAEKDNKNCGLKKTEDYVLATDVSPYGFDFEFGTHDVKKSRVKEFYHTHLGLPEKEEVVQTNLDLTVKGLENIVEKTKTDFVLVEDLQIVGKNLHGKGQLLIKR
jgi:hypothetical protein